jgi:hypothetical protein
MPESRAMIDFEWDPEKASQNKRKHGVSFSEASTAFADPLSLTIFDPDHSEAEDRFLLLGQATSGRLLVIVTPTAVVQYASSVLARLIAGSALNTSRKIKDERQLRFF